MSISRFSIEKRGRIFDDPEAVIQRHVRTALSEIAAFGEREIKRRTPAGATGDLRSEVFGEVRLRPGPVVLWGTPTPYGPAVEEGRRPGKMPPPDALRPWVERQLNVPRRESKGVAFVIARALGRKGKKGRKMFAKSVKPIREFALKVLELRMKKIADDLNR